MKVFFWVTCKGYEGEECVHEGEESPKNSPLTAITYGSGTWMGNWAQQSRVNATKMNYSNSQS